MGTYRVPTFCAAGALALIGNHAALAQPPADPAAPSSSAAVVPAGAPASAPEAQQVTVTATRIATPAIDVPASVDVIDLDAEHDRPGVNISESLAGVPGLLARDRQNYAQDVQISVRGFGARSTFGIRGVRLYVDGIPGTMPDGQGQITNVDLGSAAVVEVLRGPFSALYGNSSGGVIQVFTEDGQGAPKLTGGFGAGSNGERRSDVKLSGADGNLGYVLSATHFQTDGWREHSAARRDIENAKLTLQSDADTKITIVANAVDVPDALDPMGLTRAELEADPRGVDPSALTFDTRKSTSQQQLGGTVVHKLDAADSVQVLLYGGHRSTEQFQSIPVAAQQSPLSPGGVIRLDRDYAGTDVRWTRTGTLAGGPASLVAGVALDSLREHRTGYENFVDAGGTQVTGVQGALRRDELNGADDLDPYVQAQWQPAADWTLAAGVRRSTVHFKSTDHYVTSDNPDDSGAATDVATLPVGAVMYAISPDLRAYATAGRGFETPTLNEIAYRPNGETGLNFDLRPARSDNTELGLKGHAGSWGDWRAAVFVVRTRDEIVTLSNTGGRSTYQNVGATKRQGVELSWEARPLPDWQLVAAYTFLDATYDQSFLTCTSTPCPVPDVQVPAGNRLPGVARHDLDASVDWTPYTGLHAGIEGRYLSSVPVNDVNSDYAPGYFVANLHAGWTKTVGAWTLSAFARVDDIADRKYIGSVIVNEGNGRYFEPAPGRTWFAGVSATAAF